MASMSTGAVAFLFGATLQIMLPACSKKSESDKEGATESPSAPAEEKATPAPPLPASLSPLAPSATWALPALHPESLLPECRKLATSLQPVAKELTTMKSFLESSPSTDLAIIRLQQSARALKQASDAVSALPTSAATEEVEMRRAEISACFADLHEGFSMSAQAISDSDEDKAAQLRARVTNGLANCHLSLERYLESCLP